MHLPVIGSVIWEKIKYKLYDGAVQVSTLCCSQKLSNNGHKIIQSKSFSLFSETIYFGDGNMPKAKFAHRAMLKPKQVFEDQTYNFLFLAA